MRLLRRVLPVVVAVACVAGVILFQSHRPSAAAADPRVFVPSSGFYRGLPGSFRTSIADAYWLYVIQYYGEHLKTDQKFDSLGPMVDLVTSLSPHFRQAYFTGAFALIDAGRPDLSYKLLEQGFKENRTDWHFPAYLGFFVYTYANNKDKDRIAADWYQKAAAIPGRPAYIPRLAAALFTKGHDREKAMLMWAQAYAQGDKYSQARAVKELDKLLPTEKQARMKAVAQLRGVMAPDDFMQFVADVFEGYY